MQSIGLPLTVGAGTVIFGWTRYDDNVSFLPKREQCDPSSCDPFPATCVYGTREEINSEQTHVTGATY
jgi:hypothetical protein